MRGNFRIRLFGERAAQEFLRVVEIAEPEVSPTHAVQDKWILWGKRQRLLDQFEAFRRTRRSIDERIAQRIECLRIVGLELDQSAEARLDSSTRSSFSATMATSYSRSAESGSPASAELRTP